MSVKKWIPLAIILILMVVAYASGITNLLTFENLKAHRHTIEAAVIEHPLALPLLYMALYIAVVALSLPGGALLTLIGGFVFDLPALLYVICSATLGATALFLAAKTTLGASLQKKVGFRLKKFQQEIEKNQVSYLLFLRFLPIFPFWLVNLAPAFTRVSLFTYMWTTFIGIIPGSFVYVQAGRGLGAIFNSGEKFSLNAIFNNQIKLALLAIAFFALLPIVIKKILNKK